MADTKQPTELEIVQAQNEILEARVIELSAEKAGLETENTELKKLISENNAAQTVLSTATAGLSEEIDEKQNKIDVFPDGLTTSETDALLQARQAEINELAEKQQKYRAYIRGEL
jgi:regulator of replication initiation timing